ncbi:MAG: hypothetical protein WD226_11365 [Planctomycetota bacterium]
MQADSSLPSPAGLLLLAALVASSAWRLRPAQFPVASAVASVSALPRSDGEPPIRVLRATPGVGDTLAKRLLDARWRVPAAARAAASGAVEGLGPRRLAALAEHGLLPDGAPTSD